MLIGTGRQHFLHETALIESLQELDSTRLPRKLQATIFIEHYFALCTFYVESYNRANYAAGSYRFRFRVD
jgi:hypothetical protein